MKKQAEIIPISAFSQEARSRLAWALAFRNSDDPKAAIIRAIRNGATLPDDYEERQLIADVLEGKHTPKRERGRPKERNRWSLEHAIVERAIAEDYNRWLERFQRDRELAWLGFEALRLHDEHPDASVWRRGFDLGEEKDRRAYCEELKVLGAGPCPPRLQGGKTPRDLAQAATVRQRAARWKALTGNALTPANVARIVSRTRNCARKSK